MTANNAKTSELSSYDKTSSMGSGMTGSAGTVSASSADYSGIVSNSKNMNELCC